MAALTVSTFERLPTLAVAWGEWLGPVALALGVALLALARLAGRRAAPGH